ncbi:unnamed protein product [Somion occarium]|uniref:Uncharacterized protein n=1 Tax=Somion occarium TaxID=3059160 RepID=A0ABP1CJV7_9APHY
MSSQDTPVTNGTSETHVITSTFAEDVTLLAAMLDRSADPINDTDIAELLRQIETANGVAQGVESRLEGVLDHLDALLDSLESAEMKSLAEAHDSESSSREAKPDRKEQGV